MIHNNKLINGLNPRALGINQRALGISPRQLKNKSDAEIAEGLRAAAKRLLEIADKIENGEAIDE